MDRPVRTPVPVSLPPHDLGAEEAAVGGLLYEPGRFPTVAGLLSAEDFYSPTLARVFGVIAALNAEGQQADAVTVHAKVPDVDQHYLARIMLESAGGVYLDQHARIVKDRAMSRAILHASMAMSAQVYGGAPPADVAAEARRALDAAEEGSGGDVLMSMAATGDAAYAEAENQAGVRVRFDLPALDGRVSALRPGQFAVIGARPGAGKTALACHLFLGAARRGYKPVLASYEMTPGDLWMRLACGEAGIPMQRVLAREASEDDLVRLGACRARLDALDARIAYRPRLTLDRLFAACRRASAALVIVDYLQLVPMPDGETREQQVAAASRACKLAAQELGAVVVVCAQLNRGVEHRGDGASPRLADLRESGALEQDADVVILLDREELRAADPRKGSRPPPRRGVIMASVAKNRNGPVGHCELGWNGPLMRVGQVDA